MTDVDLDLGDGGMEMDVVTSALVDETIEASEEPIKTARFASSADMCRALAAFGETRRAAASSPACVFCGRAGTKTVCGVSYRQFARARGGDDEWYNWYEARCEAGGGGQSEPCEARVTVLQSCDRLRERAAELRAEIDAAKQRIVVAKNRNMFFGTAIARDFDRLADDLRAKLEELTRLEEAWRTKNEPAERQTALRQGEEHWLDDLEPRLAELGGGDGDGDGDGACSALTMGDYYVNTVLPFVEAQRRMRFQSELAVRPGGTSNEVARLQQSRYRFGAFDVCRPGYVLHTVRPRACDADEAAAGAAMAAASVAAEPAEGKHRRHKHRHRRHRHDT